MPTKLFISGKNWMLSLAELTSYFKAREIEFEIQFFSGEFFVLSFEKDFDASAIADLGGTIKIGEVKTKFPTETIKEAFLKKNKQAKSQIIESLASSGLVDGMSKLRRRRYCLGLAFTAQKALFGRRRELFNGLLEALLKMNSRDLGKKANFMGFGNDRKLAQLSHVEVLKKNLVENKAEVLFCIGRTETWVAYYGCGP